MKTRTKITVAASLAVLLAGVGVAGVSQAHSEKEEYRGGHGMGMGKGMGGGMGGGMGKGGHGGQGMMRMFDRFDSNGDGSVTQAEIDEMRATRLARFDTNGDGSLTLKEYEALWLDAAREHMVDRFQDLDANGDGEVTKAEFGDRFSQMVKFMDRNGDGVLNSDDMGRQGRQMRDKDDN